MKVFVIVVAGGSGLRMGAPLPKQFLLVKGRPILQHTLSRIAGFYGDSNVELELILALPESHISFWEELCTTHNFTIPHLVVAGGDTRFHSVKNALGKVKGLGMVAIHDGVRPLVSKQTWFNCMEVAERYGAAVPVMEMTESVRQISEVGSVAVNRADYRLVQTPQVFRSSLILQAYDQDYYGHFTDDASVVEHLGAVVHLAAGNVENIKITRQSDLALAEVLLDYLLRE